jgi:hypothetical protein
MLISLFTAIAGHAVKSSNSLLVDGASSYLMISGEYTFCRIYAPPSLGNTKSSALSYISPEGEGIDSADYTMRGFINGKLSLEAIDVELE